jgi:hypothetical protein
MTKTVTDGAVDVWKEAAQVWRECAEARLAQVRMLQEEIEGARASAVSWWARAATLEKTVAHLRAQTRPEGTDAA